MTGPSTQGTERLYRIASVVFLFFAAGHTLGFLTFTPPTSEALQCATR
jgi:hypothetical protein